jgi:hypothetical protein
MMSASPSNVSNDSLRDSLPGIQEYRPNIGSSDLSNRGWYESADKRSMPQQNCSRNLRDPDGDDSDSPRLKSNFEEDRIYIPDFSNDGSNSMLLPMMDDTDSSHLDYVDSKMPSQTYAPDTNQYNFSMQSRPSIYDDDSFVHDAKCQDLFYNEQDSLDISHATRSEQIGRTNMTAESDYLCYGRASRRYDTYYNDTNLSNETRKMEYVRDREPRFNSQYRTTSSSISGTSLSDYDMRIRRKCHTEMAVEQMAQRTIEIIPGVSIQDDFYLPCSCICCNLTLFCIQDAAYVLCPACFNVSPMENLEDCNDGMGLGFTIEELLKWQNEIIMNSRCVDGTIR